MGDNPRADQLKTGVGRVPSAGLTAQRFRENMGTWLTVNVVLATLLVCLAGYMKVSERTPKLDRPSVQQTPIGPTAEGNG